MTKLQETDRFFITVPKSIVVLKKWKAGTNLSFGIDKETGLVYVANNKDMIDLLFKKKELIVK